MDTSEEQKIPKVVGACMNKTFPFDAALQSTELERFVKRHKKPWFWNIVPGLNFNEVS